MSLKSEYTIVSRDFKVFDKPTCAALKFYVYLLFDPGSNNQIFYVGKGSANRVYDHAKQADFKAKDSEVARDRKLDLIRSIIQSQQDVGIKILRHGLSEQEAFHVEAAAIDLLGEGLTNKQAGHGTVVGLSSDSEIKKIYGLPNLQTSSRKAMFINIDLPYPVDGLSNALENIYQRVRFCWKVQLKRANQAEVIVAMSDKVTLAAFQPDPDGWIAATDENFPDHSGTEPGRYGFRGNRAIESMWDEFVGENGKLLPREIQHIRWPIRYLNIS